LTHHEVVVLLVSLAVMLLCARLAAEIGQAFRLPAVLAEIGVGILLGPTWLGSAFPGLWKSLFPPVGGTAMALEGLCKIAVILMMFVAGLEVRLSVVLRQGRAALFTSATSIALPFAVGFLAAWKFPEWMGFAAGDNRFLHALFLGTALSITALPVIARILMDMNIFRTRVGSTIIAAAMLDDIAGWLCFSFILGLMPGDSSRHRILFTLAAISAFVLFMLTAGRKILHHFLGWMQKRVPSTGGLLAVLVGLSFLCASFTEFIGLHAILGAFIAGIAMGDSAALPEKARDLAGQFFMNIFAPLYFVSIGLRLDFAAHFNPLLVLLVVGLAFAGKISGAWMGARLGGFSPRESLAIGFGMNARGAMEIILGKTALEAGLINADVFVALVIMAIVTSLTSAPFIRLSLGKDKSKDNGMDRDMDKGMDKDKDARAKTPTLAGPPQGGKGLVGIALAADGE
jgi:K+:H+ antiporter